MGVRRAARSPRTKRKSNHPKELFGEHEAFLEGKLAGGAVKRGAAPIGLKPETGVPNCIAVGSG